MGHDNASKSSTANDVTTNITSAPAIGKTSTTQGLPPGPTGDTYIDHGAVCERGGGADCFLTAAQRGRLISELQMRILDAGAHYVAAAEASRIDKLMEKDQDMPLILSIVFDLATAYFSARAIAALAKLKTKATGALGSDPYADLDVDTKWRDRASSAVSKVTPAHMAAGVGSTFGQAKMQIIAHAKKEVNAPATNKRGAAVSYLEQLTNDAQLTFEDLRQRLPAEADDGELLAWRTAFDPREHTVAMYKAAIAEKLARFEASGVQQIGRNGASVVAEEHSNSLSSNYETDGWIGVVKHGGELPDRDSSAWRNQFHDPGVYVAWHAYASGAPKELVYRAGGRSEPGNVFAGESDVGPRYGGTAPGPKRKLDHVVPTEFVDYAIARHTQIWGSAPGTEMIDDSTWYWAPERAKRAEENKAKDPFLVPATSHEDLAAKSRQRTGSPTPPSSPPPPPPSSAAPPARPVPRLMLPTNTAPNIDHGGDPEPGDFR
jgi:hypothetical protein